MEKLLALAQHLDIPYIEDNGTYYFGVKMEDYEAEFEDLDNQADEEREIFEGLNLGGWAVNQDNYIDFENEVEVNGDYYTFRGEEYLICTDDEADTYWNEDIDTLIEDCILPEIPERYQAYFDRDKYARDCKFDGRGNSLARYDGVENEENVNNTWYYLYRTN